MPSRVLIKICGTTSVGDAQLAARAGADYLGVIVEHAPSPRSVSLENARAIFAATELPVAAVTVNRDREFLLRIQRELQPAALQLHGDESPSLVRELVASGATIWAACENRARATEMRDAGASAILIDARQKQNDEVIYGGTGARSDWNLARELVQSGLAQSRPGESQIGESRARVILAGGLNPESVGAAIEFVNPWMVDVVSGVEKKKGEKDAAKLNDFIAAARGTNEKSTPE